MHSGQSLVDAVPDDLCITGKAPVVTAVSQAASARDTLAVWPKGKVNYTGYDVGNTSIYL